MCTVHMHNVICSNFPLFEFEYHNICLCVIYFTAVREDLYFLAGRAIAVSMVHGGPSPGFVSNTMYDCLVKGPANTSPTIEDVSDLDLRQKIKQVSYRSNYKTCLKMQKCIC